MAALQTEQEPSSPSENKQLPTPPPERVEALSGPSGTPAEKMDGSKSTEITSSPEKDKTGEPSPPGKNTRKTEPESDDSETSSTQKADAKSEERSVEAKDDSKNDAKQDKKDDKAADDSKAEKDKKDDEKKEEEKKRSLPKGMKPGVKDLWAKTDAQCKCCTTWVEENPDEGKDIESSDECLQHAIVVRRKKKHEGNRKPLKIDSIVVHSPLAKRVLQKVFSGYPDIVIDLDELVFDAPFAPFFFRWNAFQKAVQDEEDEMTKSHLKLLQDALQKELEKPIQRQKDLLRHKAIDFELLWTLYVPGTLMYSHDNGHDRLYETGDSEYWQDLSGMKFSIRCDMIDWDGEKFGKVTLSEVINSFKGTRQITSLPSYPLIFHPKAEEIKKKCIERGRRFEQLAGVHCKDYKGTAIEYTKYSVQTVTNKRHLEGRIMLDEELFSKFNPDESQTMRELGEDADEVKKAEVEALKRLAEQVQKAKEALKKAEEEIKKEEEEQQAKKKGEKESNEDGTKCKGQAEKDGDKDGDKDGGKNGDEDGSRDGEKKANEKSEVIDAAKDGKSTEPQQSAAVEDKSDSGTDGQEILKSVSEKIIGDHEEQKGEEVAATATKTEETSSEKHEELASSASTDCEGAPTPTSETEDDEKEAKAYSNNEKQDLKDDQLAICNSWLRGYSLSNQKWATFSVEHISDVIWNDDAFNELTLPAEYRELILATIQSQIRQNRWKQKMERVEKEQKPLSALRKDGADAEEDDDDPAQFDDFIAQKGLGYIMLFSGNPGVGKTATAESIAELLHVPLCIISVGNLGTTAESVESALQDILELSSKWNAVLLLDEADIFLEQRTKHDLHRNAVVSVFLRLLEYYQGVLCLTTNRSEEIDVAFHSRIHISLPFPDLTESNREQIWRHFAKITNKKHDTNIAKRKAVSEKQASSVPAKPAAEEEPIAGSDAAGTNGTKTAEDPQSVEHENQNMLIDLSSSDFRKLSQTPLNGRQIKNCFKTAVLLASYQKEKVQLKHIKTALKTIDGNGLGKREVGGMYY